MCITGSFMKPHHHPPPPATKPVQFPRAATGNHGLMRAVGKMPCACRFPRKGKVPKRPVWGSCLRWGPLPGLASLWTLGSLYSLDSAGLLLVSLIPFGVKCLVPIPRTVISHCRKVEAKQGLGKGLS